VATLLRERGIAFAVIGAAAIAVHGISRATRDLDLLVMSLDCLSPSTWATLDGVLIDIRRGDADDPLAGMVRVASAVEAPIDVVVGRAGWQRSAIERAPVRTVEGLAVPVVTAADLILLKLYAQAPQDAWDIEQLLSSGDRTGLIAAVEASLSALPEDARRLWARIVAPR
jgi:hypothetical protein